VWDDRDVAEGSRSESASASQRLDVWLDVACLFKTRSLAQSACRSGKVEVNGAVARPSRPLHAGDELRITRAAGQRQTVVVRGFAPRHVAKPLARELYEDRTPPPSPEALEERRLRRQFPVPPSTRPASKRDRRALRRLKQRD
jgi:ribosome-associated heat shock protein Hsp15